MPTAATPHRWSDIPPELITDSIARQYITADRVTVARFELKRGGIVPRHAHESEQVSMVLSGGAFRSGRSTTRSDWARRPCWRTAK